MPSNVSARIDSKIHAELIRFWNQPPAKRPTPDREFTYYRNADIEPSAVLTRLRGKFPSHAIRPALVFALEKALDVLGRGRMLSERQRFLTACCVELLDLDPDVAADSALVSRLVRDLDPLYWHRALRRLVGNHLTAVELMDTLHDGMKSGPSTALRIPALEGVRLYRSFVRQNAASPKSRSWFESTRATVKKLEQHPCGEIRRDAEFTSRWLAELASGATLT